MFKEDLKKIKITRLVDSTLTKNMQNLSIKFPNKKGILMLTPTLLKYMSLSLNKFKLGFCSDTFWAKFPFFTLFFGGRPLVFFSNPSLIGTIISFMSECYREKLYKLYFLCFYLYILAPSLIVLRDHLVSPLLQRPFLFRFYLNFIHLSLYHLRCSCSPFYPCIGWIFIFYFIFNNYPTKSGEKNERFWKNLRQFKSQFWCLLPNILMKAR